MRNEFYVDAAEEIVFLVPDFNVLGHHLYCLLSDMLVFKIFLNHIFLHEL